MEKLKTSRGWVMVAVITLVFAIAYGATFDPKLNIGGDNAAYIHLARNLADGLGYSQITAEGNYMPASHFPPGYSFILSVFMMIGIDSLLFFKILNGMFLLGVLLLLFVMVRRLTDNAAVALSAILLSVLSPQILGFASIVMSEMSYLFFTVAGFYCLYRYAESGDTKRFWCRPCFWLAIVSLTVCYYIRTIGMSALFAMLVFFAFRREWKQLGAAIGGVVLLLLPWSLRNAANGIESRYFGTIMTVNPWRPEEGTISSVGEMIEKMVTNFDDCVIKGFKELLFPFVKINPEHGSSFLAVIGGLLILALVLYGAWNLGRLRWLMVAYLVGNIGLFMLWHGGNGSRYVVPLTPILFVCFYTGVYALLRRYLLPKAPRTMARLPYAFLLMALPMLSPMQVQAQTAKMPTPPAYENFYAIAREMNKQAPRHTVVCARKTELFMYYAPQLIAVNYKYTLDPDDLLRDLIAKKVEYVVLEQLGYSSTPRYLLPAIEQNPELFPVIWHLQEPDTYLLKFERDKALRKLAAKEAGTVKEGPETGTTPSQSAPSKGALQEAQANPKDASGESQVASGNR